MTSVLFLTLKVFSATGGIEKVCRVAGKALYEELLDGGLSLRLMSLYDEQKDADGNKYFPTELFSGYGNRRVNFIRQAVMESRAADIVLLSHINLLPVGWMIKKIFPKKKLFLYAHGIEIWEPVGIKKKMLGVVDHFWAISHFTKTRLQKSGGIPTEKITILNNCLDPFLPLPNNTAGKETLAKRYGIEAGDKVLFVLNRLRGDERYKGYDTVIAALAKLKRKDIQYIIAGKAEPGELSRVQKLITETGLQNQVKFAGYIPDEELPAHFAIADLYIMPSSGEGFGIVFLEAMYYGLPVIAGNKDGSVDALLNGKLGKLVDPGNVLEIAETIDQSLENKKFACPDQQLLMDHFGYEVYKRKLAAALGLQQTLVKLNPVFRSTEPVH